ncbi:MAG TPA: VOC family protein [Acetobacteraceae bacterium]|nr:VOC family protein [Acetobacteraceae bacterium]
MTALRRLGLTVRDLEASLAFYRGAFGCEVTAEDQDFFGSPARRVRLRLGAQELELAAFDPPGAPWPPDAASNDITFQHFAIAVASMREAYAHLEQIPGWTPISTAGPVALPASAGGVTAFKFRDPEGHPLELLQFPDRKNSANGALFQEINHSAIVVSDDARSIAFYTQGLGLTESGGSLNQGETQARLDGLDAPVVRVTALDTVARAAPHLELLCYREPPGNMLVSPDKKPNDVISTRLIFVVDDPLASAWRLVKLGAELNGSDAHAAFLRDPDGHDLVLTKG